MAVPTCYALVWLAVPLLQVPFTFHDSQRDFHLISTTSALQPSASRSHCIQPSSHSKFSSFRAPHVFSQSNIPMWHASSSFPESCFGSQKKSPLLRRRLSLLIPAGCKQASTRSEKCKLNAGEGQWDTGPGTETGPARE